MKIVLISPYEIGRQPFGLAEPAALLRDVGGVVEEHDVDEGLALAGRVEAAREESEGVAVDQDLAVAEPDLAQEGLRHGLGLRLQRVLGDLQLAEERIEDEDAVNRLLKLLLQFLSNSAARAPASHGSRRAQ